MIAAATMCSVRAPSADHVAFDGSQLAYHASRLLQHVMQNGRKAAQLPAVSSGLPSARWYGIRKTSISNLIMILSCCQNVLCKVLQMLR